MSRATDYRPARPSERSSGTHARSIERPNKKLLVITYVFPPAAWVGVHRTLKYCRYLGRHGWTPVVLTARTDGVTFTDESLLQQLPPEVDVYRTLDMDPAKWEDKLAQRKLRHKKHVSARPDERASSASLPAASTGRWTAWRKSLTDWLKILLKDSPDSHVFWVPFAIFRGMRILLSQRIDIVYCSTPPHSSHIAAFALAKAFRKPYVLDFRDPWYVAGSIRPPTDKIEALLTAETRIKRAIVRRAAHVICVSRGECEEMRAEFPDLEASRFSYITNGYDPADVVGDSRMTSRASDKLLLIHAGTINAGVAGEFFTALETLHSRDSRLGDKLEVRLLGEIAIQYDNTVRRLEDLGVLKIMGMVPHSETLRMIRDSDVLLIFMGGSLYRPSHIPSKTFEYLQAEKPILAIAADGELAEISRRSGLGIIVPPGDTARIAATIQELLASRNAGTIERSPDRDFIKSFERPALAAELANVLDSVIEARDMSERRP